MEITEFLAARYDEAFEVTQLAAAEPPHPSGLPIGTAICYGLESVGLSLNYQAYMTMFDPDKVLADLAAKRALLAYLETAAELVLDHNLWSLPERADHGLRLLAAPYAEHPDFDPAWRIDA